MPSLPRIAFLGVGLMGAPMAHRLLAAAYRLRVWNRHADKAAALVAAGAIAAQQPSDAVADADIVISMLADGAVVRQVMEQALPALRPGALWIDMSSTGQDEALACHALLESHGIAFMDAPVSGGVAGAQAGALAIMAGGTAPGGTAPGGTAPDSTAPNFTRALPILRTLGTPVLVGAVGSGQVAKLCNQLIVGATLHVVAEALLLAEAAGADPAAVRQAISGGFAASRILEVHGQRMLTRDFLPGGQVKTQLKDMHNILAAAAAADLHLPLTELVTRRYASIADAHPHADHSAALLALEQLNPGRRLGQGPDRLPN
ncbi:MAG: NAD(P)-dependent oxidoreductase [Pseudomonadota bacterium]